MVQQALRETTSEAAHGGQAEEASPWFMLGVLFIGQMLAVGGIAYGYGLLVKPLSAEYGLTRTGGNSGLVLLLAGMAAFSPLIGFALDRIAGRLVVICGALLFGVGCLAVALAPSLPWLGAAAFLLVAPGGAALGPLSGSTLVARCFGRHRGRALGAISVAASLGGLLVVPGMAWLVEAQGWRSAVVIIGAAAVLLVAAPALRMAAAAPPPRPIQRGKTFRARPLLALIRTADFWLITLAVGLIMAADQAVLVSLVPYQTDRGFSLQAATAIVSVISGTAIAGTSLAYPKRKAANCSRSCSMK